MFLSNILKTNNPSADAKTMKDSNPCPEVPLVPQVNSQNELFVCACGWFWFPQLRFDQLKGVVRTLVGYSGGNKLNPTYQSIKDHTEALLIEYDPNVISYEQLVTEWTKMHSLTRKSTKCQYRSALWYLNDEQKQRAEDVLEKIRTAQKIDKIYSAVEPVTKFYRAEEYHQNYIQKQGGGGGAACPY